MHFSFFAETILPRFRCFSLSPFRSRITISQNNNLTYLKIIFLTFYKGYLGFPRPFPVYRFRVPIAMAAAK